MAKEIILQAYVNDILENCDIIGGKVFIKKDGKEIFDLRKFIATNARKTGNIILVKDINTIHDTCMLYSEDAKWPDAPLIAEAKELGPCDDKMPFDLDTKQLMILNRICFHPDSEIMFITTGIGGSGKSTFLNILRQIYENDFAAANLSDLSDPFILAEAVKKRLICSDELAKGEIDAKRLKALISQQPIFINPKNVRGYTMPTQSVLFYCCNQAPRMDLTDSGVLRRIVYYERNTKIKNPNTKLKDKIFSKDELLCILRNALRYEEPNWLYYFTEETHKYLLKNNSVFMFNNIKNYEDYVWACRSNGIKAIYSQPVWYELKLLIKEFAKEDAKAYAFLSRNLYTADELPF